MARPPDTGTIWEAALKSCPGYSLCNVLLPFSVQHSARVDSLGQGPRGEDERRLYVQVVF